MIDRSRQIAGRAAGRIAQGLVYLAPKPAERVDAELRRLLEPAELALTTDLSVSDRAHMLAVYRRLVRSGCQDPDLLKAALLHDIGKADRGARVGLVHRTIAVLLRASSPALLLRLATGGDSGWRRPFRLIVDHPAIGARNARDAGCNERVCWLIEQHHAVDAGGDTAVQALQSADEVWGRSW